MCENIYTEKKRIINFGTVMMIFVHYNTKTKLRNYIKELHKTKRTKNLFSVFLLPTESLDVS